MEISVPLRRIRQFLLHVRSYGFRSAYRTAWLFFRVRANLFLNLVGVESHEDMPWTVFESRFLSRRDIYKGVFVQNPVIIWNARLFQRPQQMALALGRLGYLVIYKTPDSTLDKVTGVRNVAPNVYLVNAESFDFIEDAVYSTYSTRSAHAFDEIDKSNSCFRVIYEYVDEIDPVITGKETINHLIEEKRIAFNENKYDFIVATARELADEAVKATNPNKVLYVPNGVDCWHYRNPLHNNMSLPNDLLKFRESYENIVGYFGAIAPWLWYDEIKKLVNNRPDLGFVFIGPDYSGREVARLPRAENVLWLDTVSYDILPAYASRFDVCFIPFEPGRIAHTTSPLKLFEYFALEKPVVATSQLYECTAFDVVFAGDGAESWSAAIDNAISFKSNIAFKDRLARLADENSWDNRARSLEKVFFSTFDNVSIVGEQHVETDAPLDDIDLDLNKYDSDKVIPYLKYYAPFLQPLRDKKISLLEIGVHKYGSLMFWHDYLLSASISGVDIQLQTPPEDFPTERMNLFCGDQTDVDFLSRISSSVAPDGWDVIIDDASHLGYQTKITFWHLFENYLKSGGLYVIEDWGTGYYDFYPDGKALDLEFYHRVPEILDSHTYGLVGFVKQLVDETGAAAATYQTVHDRQSRFRSMTIFPGAVFIRKSG